MGVSGCAVLLPIGLGVQAVISTGSDIVSGVKWWEDRKFQADANAALRAQAEEIRKLREEIAQTREQLHEDLMKLQPQP